MDDNFVNDNHGTPRADGIIGHIPHESRALLKQIFNKFWINEFACVNIRKIKGLKDFDCRKLRAWRNYGAVTFTTKRIKRGEKPVRVWKLTSSAIQYFTTH